MVRKNKKKRRVRLYHIILLFISMYILVIVVKQNKLKQELILKEKEVQADIELLQEDIEALNKEVEKKGSIEFLENTAREELGMVKPNEIIYIDKKLYKNSIFNFLNKPTDWHKCLYNIY